MNSLRLCCIPVTQKERRHADHGRARISGSVIARLICEFVIAAIAINGLGGYLR
jgi:hypothetical protein